VIFFASTPAKKSPLIGELKSWVTTSFNLPKDERKKGERRRRVRRERERERERTIIKEKFSMAKMVYKFIITKNITWTLALIVAKCNLPCNFLRRGH